MFCRVTGQLLRASGHQNRRKNCKGQLFYGPRISRSRGSRQGGQQRKPTWTRNKCVCQRNLPKMTIRF
eukprot:jgi/Botrbrau1/20085/Bobra.200_1s0088.1